MSKGENDIFSDGQQLPDDLLKYIQKEMDNGEQNAFEQATADDPFAQDALDGLAAYSKKSELPKVVHSLNAQLEKNLLGKKKPNRRPMQKMDTTIYAIIIILLLAILAWAVIYKL